MYISRSLISHLYRDLLRTHHTFSPPVLVLVALEPDALCACRILTALLKRDYIPHKIQPIAGYGDLSRAGLELVRPMRTCDGGSGGIVVCLGVGGLIDLEEALGLEDDGEGNGKDGTDGGANGEGQGLGNVDVWVFDSRRPWHLSNVFGGHGLTTDELLNGADKVRRERGIERGRVLQNFKSGRGGIFVFDDGDIEEELTTEREAYCEIEAMPDLGDEDDVSDVDGAGTDSESDDEDGLPPGAQPTRKRKSPSDSDDGSEDDSNSVDGNNSSPPRQKRKHSAHSSSPVTREKNDNRLRKRLVRMRRKHERVLRDYYSLGTSYSEPVSSMMYSLASELGREDNDLLWQAIVGVSSLELYGRTATGTGLAPISTHGGSAGWTGSRGERIRAILRDEARRLNPTDPAEVTRERAMGDSQMAAIPTHARSANDMSIRLSPEPRFLLVRHWSLYDSMLHSPYLSSRLQMWSDAGVRRLHKLLAKMGISLAQSRQNYVHMDIDIKQGLRERLLKYAPIYGLEGLLPTSSHTLGKEGWGFVRFWGWKACLSAADVSIIIGAVLELGKSVVKPGLRESFSAENRGPGNNRVDLSKDMNSASSHTKDDHAMHDNVMNRFWAAYDALGSVDLLKSHIHTAQHLHRAIFRTGKSLIIKKQIHHLRAFRIAVVKEGPDIQLFSHPGALVKLALWIQEAVEEINGSRGDTKGNELVLAGLDDERGVYVVVGLGGGSKPELSQHAVKERTRKREAKRKRKEAAAEAKRQAKEAQRAQRRKKRVAGLGEGNDDGGDEGVGSADGNHETESESSEEEEEEEDDDDDDDDDDDSDGEDAGPKTRKNGFGLAFLEVAEETGARVKLDSFEHSVVEVKKEDLSGFLEGLSMKRVVR